ncbi:hypothetical protein GCM10027181_08330 [Rheinheimera gaetbuli]
MAEQFAVFAQALVQSPALPLGQAPLLSAQEQAQLAAWQGTTAAYPQGCLHELVEQQAQASPSAVALVQGDTQLSYAQLNAQANRLARYLRADRQVHSETLVGICMPRSPQQIVAILAVLKAGGAYVPLDPEYPQERLALMQADAELGTVLTLQNQAADWLPLHSRVELDSVAVQASLAGYADDNLSLVCQPEQLAYVIYTSGSTGTPKGVMVEHRNVVALCHWHIAAFSVDKDSVATQTANIAFDASVWEVWPYLLAGGRIVQLTSAEVLDTQALWRCLTEQDVTHCFLVTPLAVQFMQHRDVVSGRLQYLLVGGDVLPMLDIPALPFAVINNYGPTECTVVATSGRVDLQAKSHAIGKPVSNSYAYVLDSQQQRVPVGVSGELYVGGAGLARGYLNKGELTAERFIANPYYVAGEAGSSARLYRTGDMVRWREDGQLEYLGRNDFQVKVRGYRIELGEIESALQSQDGIAEALVLAQDTAAGKQLVAYYRAEQSVSADVLRQRLSERLPEYMVPAYWMALEVFPLTANGKVDRKALPPVEAQAGEYEAPQGETEQALAQLWQQLLGVGQISRHANFFMLGGHSLLIIRLRQAIKQRWQQDVTVQQLFANPLLTQQAFLLKSGVLAQQQICHLLKDGDAKKPVFIVHPVGGDTLCYQQLMQDWSLPNAVFGICHPLVAGSEFTVADGDLKTLASLYLQQIRAVQAEGPYHILGWSLGGVIALEIASQLHRDDAAVAYLGLLDSYWPQPDQVTQSLLQDWTPDLFTPADWQLFDEEHQLAELCQATGLSLEQQRTVVWSGVYNLSHYQANTASHVSKIQYFSAAGQGGTDNDKAACLSHLRQISGHCQVIELNATHHNIVHQPNTSIINAWIRRAMQQPKELQTGPKTKLELRSVGEMEIQGEIK